MKNSILEMIGRQRKLDRENVLNPVCPGCNRRERPELICHQVGSFKVCAECADQDLFNRTGCRFGKSICNHEDCKDGGVQLMFCN